MIKQLLFAFTFLSITSLYSQIGFQEHEVTNFTYIAKESKMADLDNDGDLDIISYGTYGIDWYENKYPEQGFMHRQTIVTLPGYNFIRSIDITDFDGDGDLDILGVESYQNMLFLITNLGQENFAELEILKTIENLGFVEHIDMDNDGDKDLVYRTMITANQVMGYYENTQQQNNYMILHVIDDGSNIVHEVEMADFNMDGYPDIFYRLSSSIAWIQNNGNGTFSDLIIIPTPNEQYFFHDIADIDNDDDLDFIGNVRQGTNRKLIYMLNDGTGNFGAEHIIRQNLTDIKDVKLDDMDNDGQPDLIVALKGTNPAYFTDIVWYKNSGLNNFTDMPVVDLKVLNVTMIETFDMNNDGAKDIITSSHDHRTTTYQNSGTGTFGAPKYPAAANLWASAAAAGDIDGDGDIDIVTSSDNEGEIYWYQKSDADATYGSQIIVSDGAAVVRGQVVVSDIDGDGNLDIVSVSEASSPTTFDFDRVAWYRNIDGLGNFSARMTIDFGVDHSPDGLAVYDVDGDGDNDIVTSLSNSGNGDKIVWYANDGAGIFSAAQVISEGAVDGVTALKEADIDNDGDLDLVCSSSVDHTVSWFENLNGLGSFGPKQVITSNAQGVADVVVTDLDSDGDNDVVYIYNDSTDNQILWQPNQDGSGTFGAAVIITSNVATIGTSTLAAGDIDNDGDIDIVVGESTKTTWLENLYGTANFETPKIIADDIDDTCSLQLSDFDNDGDLDLLLASRGSHKVLWYINEGISQNTIKGVVRFDNGGDGCGANDTLLPNILVATTNGSSTQATLTFQNESEGQYRLYTEEGDYETSVIADLPPYFMLTPLSHLSAFTGVGNIDTADFCIGPIGIFNDLNVVLYPLSEARPGFEAAYQLVYKNIGTTTLTGQVSMQYDNAKMQYLNSQTAPSSQTGNTLNFNFTDLAPFETHTTIINFNVFAPPMTDIGNQLVFTSAITTSEADYTPADNTHILNQVVIGSYDPNDITCLEGDQVAIYDADKYLHYVIRFQNTGTASAINVRVLHVLDQKLDWTTFQLESMSHSGRTTITDGSLVEFMFNNIHLPHTAANEPGSHGYITFKIKPLSNTVSTGDIVNATADIYFDFNPPITTNTAVTEFVDGLGTDSFAVESFYIYPNPVKDQLMIKHEAEITRLDIFNILGRKVLTENNKSDINVSALNSGVYLISIETADGTFIRKFIKQ